MTNSVQTTLILPGSATERKRLQFFWEGQQVFATHHSHGEKEWCDEAASLDTEPGEAVVVDATIRVGIVVDELFARMPLRRIGGMLRRRSFVGSHPMR